jgi:sterol desaturase/sphingolipid hydroxylase (fatty acid hydroxylase superfamily)
MSQPVAQSTDLSVWVRFSRAAERLFQPVEHIFYVAVVKNISRLLDRIDPLSHRIEGTLFKKILQVTIFPLFMTATLVIGFVLVRNGYSFESFAATIGMFLVYGAICMPLERLIPFSRRWLKSPDASTDVMLLFGNRLFGDWIAGPLRLATIAIAVQQISPAIGQSLWPTSLHPVVQVFLLLTINDFFRYWYHRWMHESSFMWRWHAVHHSSERLYWFNGTRSHPFEGLVSGFLWAIPLAFVQAPVEIVFVTFLMGRTIGRFQHTNMDLILGPFDYIFSSPKNHRYHHSRNAREGNTNYGGDVILWDHLFGTFYMPKGKQPSDDIGLGDVVNYPQSFVGLMLAPFHHHALQKQAPLPVPVAAGRDEPEALTQGVRDTF